MLCLAIINARVKPKIIFHRIYTRWTVEMTIINTDGVLFYEQSHASLPVTIYLPDIMAPGNYYLTARRGEYLGYAQFTKQ